MGIRIDALPATNLESRSHLLAAMKDNLSVRLAVSEILQLIIKDDIDGLLGAVDIPYDGGSGGPANVDAALDLLVSSKLDKTGANIGAGAGTLLTALDFSTLSQNLRDDTTLTAYLTTLGIPAFIQSLLDDTSAAIAKRTLLVGAPDIILKNTRTTNTSGGAATGSWTRDTLLFNTEARDVNGECSLSSGLITLAAGTWYMDAFSALFATDAAQMVLYNTTAGALVSVDGSNVGYPVGYAYSGGNYSARLQLKGTFTVAASQALAIQIRTVTASGSGYGVTANPGSDITHQVATFTRLS